MIKLINETELEFTDISSEQWREYKFPTLTARIENPEYLAVTESGSHRILDKNGHSFYVPTGWVYIKWAAKEGQPHFVK